MTGRLRTLLTSLIRRRRCFVRYQRGAAISAVVLGAVAIVASRDALEAVGQTVPPPREWYVAPTGEDSHDGTLAYPWPLQYALSSSCAGGAIRAGDTVHVRGGTYSRVPKPDGPSGPPAFTLNCSGEPGRPIVYRAYGSERPVLEGAIPEFMAAGNNEWIAEPGNGPGRNLYRSRRTYRGADQFSGFVLVSGSWMTLVVHGHGGQGVGFLRSDVHTHRAIDRLGIARRQSVSGGAAVLNGTYASEGVVTLPDAAYVGGNWTNPAQVTISGTDPSGASVSETSPLGQEFEGRQLFKTVTSVTFSAAVSEMTFGTAAVARYMGPGIAFGSDGHIYVRLDNSVPQAQYNRSVLRIADPNPNNHQLLISRLNAVGLDVEAHDVIVDGLSINDFGVGILTSGPETRNLTFRNLRVRPGRHGARLGRADHVTFQNCRFDARMPSSRFWMAYSDVKGSGEAARNTRKTAIDLGSATYVNLIGNEFNEFFDGILSQTSAHDISVQRNTFRQTWDDAWQMYYGVHHVDVGYNKFFGAGISRDGTGTGTRNPNSGTVWIHHNIFAPNKGQIFWLRLGATLENGEPPPSGFDSVFDPIPLSAHGLQQHRAGGSSFPWKFYYNTVWVVDPFPQNGIGVMALEGFLGGLYDGSPHEVYNNIFVDASANARALGQNFVANTGHERYDGNIFSGWGPESPLRVLYRFVHTSSGRIDGEGVSPPLTGPRTLPAAVIAETQTYPIPSFRAAQSGWEARGVSVTGLTFDQSYRPINCQDCTTGAVDLTGSPWPWPGTASYEPWRGAVAVQP